MKKIILSITIFSFVLNAFNQQTIKTKFDYSDKNKIQNQIGVSDTPLTFTVDGKIALNSLIAISDGHLKKVADVLTILATTTAVRSCDWNYIHGPLAEVRRMNVPGVYWFARPDGTYWTLDKGRISEKLSDREYFPSLLSGQEVIGHLVVSRSTHRNTAIVAVPVHGPGNSILGALGCSIPLDSMSAQIRGEMGGLAEGLFFYSIDSKPLVALHTDPHIIFIEPMKQEDEGLQQAFREILSSKEGVVKYVFRGMHRTVIYKKSPLSGWWYGLGIIENF